MSEKKTCGRCKWWKKYPTTKNEMGVCPILGVQDASRPNCPAHNDGSYDRAVEELVRAEKGFDAYLTRLSREESNPDSRAAFAMMAQKYDLKIQPKRAAVEALREKAKESR